MIIHDMPQKTPEWDRIRKGKLTASVAEKIITPTGKPSTQYHAELGRIVAEALDLQPAEFIPPTYWMERGINLEPEARGWFQVETGRPVQKAGFIEHESGLAGISPDGYVTDKVVMDQVQPIPVELKCPKPGTHIQWLMAGGMPKKHLPQCHFQMVITGAPYMYFMSYHPTVEALLIKVERDEYTESLSIMLDAAIMTLREAIDKYTPKEKDDV